jgi:hypothetical protein
VVQTCHNVLRTRTTIREKSGVGPERIDQEMTFCFDNTKKSNHIDRQVRRAALGAIQVKKCCVISKLQITSFR